MGSSSGKFDKSNYQFSEVLYNDTVEGLPSLQGKVVAITGCTTGLGYYLALAAARKGASKILLLNRPSERAKRAEEDVRSASPPGTDVQTVELDLQRLDSARACAGAVEAVAGASGGLDVLANNAGVMALCDTRTPDGYDVQMQTNHLTHALLTKLLMPQLEAAACSRGEARVVFHSSGAREGTLNADLDAKYFATSAAGELGGDVGAISEMTGWSRGGPWNRYHQSKLANSAYAMALHDQLQARGSKVKALAVDPGYAASELATTSNQSGLMPTWLAKAVTARAQSAADGSVQITTACFGLEAESGDFYMPQQKSIGPPKKTISRGVPVVAGTERLSTSEANKETAWKASHDAVLGTEPFFSP